MAHHPPHTFCSRRTKRTASGQGRKWTKRNMARPLTSCSNTPLARARPGGIEPETFSPGGLWRAGARGTPQPPGKFSRFGQCETFGKKRLEKRLEKPFGKPFGKRLAKPFGQTFWQTFGETFGKTFWLNLLANVWENV